MSRPNYQRILDAHGKLPDQLAQDFGLRILEEKTDKKNSVLEGYEAPEVEEKTEGGKYDAVVDKDGQRLVDYDWAALRAKARADGIVLKGLKKDQIMDIYLEKFNALPNEIQS